MFGNSLIWKIAQGTALGLFLFIFLTFVGCAFLAAISNQLHNSDRSEKEKRPKDLSGLGVSVTGFKPSWDKVQWDISGKVWNDGTNKPNSIQARFDLLNFNGVRVGADSNWIVWQQPLKPGAQFYWSAIIRGPPTALTAEASIVDCTW